MFKKVAIIPREQITKVSGTAYNLPIDNVDVTNLLSRPDGNKRLVIAELLRELEYCGHILFETVRPILLKIILIYFKSNNFFSKMLQI